MQLTKVVTSALSLSHDHACCRATIYIPLEGSLVLRNQFFLDTGKPLRDFAIPRKTGADKSRHQVTMAPKIFIVALREEISSDQLMALSRAEGGGLLPISGIQKGIPGATKRIGKHGEGVGRPSGVGK